MGYSLTHPVRCSAISKLSVLRLVVICQYAIELIC